MAGSFKAVFDDSNLKDASIAFVDSNGDSYFFAIYKNQSTGLYEFDKYRVSSSVTEYFSSPMSHNGITVTYVESSNGQHLLDVAFDDTLMFSLSETMIFDFTISLPDNGSVDGSTPVDSSSCSFDNLDGNFCKYSNGAHVEHISLEYPSPLSVVSSRLVLADKDVLTVFYLVEKDGKRYEFPQAFLKKYVAPAGS